MPESDDQNIVNAILEANPDLEFTENGVEGDFLNIFEMIFTQIKAKMNCLNIILPASFKFNLKKGQFIEAKP